jgi:hypothetical protein
MQFKNRNFVGRLSILTITVCLIGALALTGFAYAKDETGECLYMKEVCQEVENYKKNWKKLTASEKKEQAKEKIKQGLTKRCNEAKKLCKESESKKKKAK